MLGGKPLPFIPGGVSSDQRIVSAISYLLANLASQLDSLEEDDAIYDIAQTLNDASSKKTQRKKLNYKAAELTRQFLLDTTNETVTMDHLEKVSGTDRWSLSRDFRALFGTSPYRYLSLRRLELVIYVSINSRYFPIAFTSTKRLPKRFFARVFVAHTLGV